RRNLSIPELLPDIPRDQHAAMSVQHAAKIVPRPHSAQIGHVLLQRSLRRGPVAGVVPDHHFRAAVDGVLVESPLQVALMRGYGSGAGGTFQMDSEVHV